MNWSLLSVVETLGLVPAGAERAREAKQWLAAREGGPQPGDDFLGPVRRASDEQLARLVPAVHAVLGIRDGGIRIIPSTDRTVEDGAHKTTWPEGEATAAPELLYLLRRAYPDKEVHITGASDLDEAPGWGKCNLLVLGGPDSNRVTRDAWNHLRPRYTMQSRKLLDADGGILVEYRESGDEVTDGSVLVRGPSPFAADRVLVLMMGLETQGTCAAATSLECLEWLRSVAPRARRLESFQVAWEAQSGLHDPWPRRGRFVAPAEPLSGGPCPSGGPATGPVANAA